jgi:hypothetical protein
MNIPLISRYPNIPSVGHYRLVDKINILDNKKRDCRTSLSKKVGCKKGFEFINSKISKKVNSLHF